VRYLSLVIGLTCEKGADVRIRKIRALVADEELLRHIERVAGTRLEKPHHAVRRQTLSRMARLYAEQPDLFARISVALRVPEETAEREQWFAAARAEQSSSTVSGGVGEQPSPRGPTVTSS
jgi:hypothetical protein